MRITTFPWKSYVKPIIVPSLVIRYIFASNLKGDSNVPFLACSCFDYGGVSVIVCGSLTISSKVSSARID